MSSPSSELSLDYKPSPSVVGGGGFAAAPLHHRPPLPEQKPSLEDFLARLEEERLKIEAFKRELPLCLQLLNNAMENYRQQLETHQTRRRPVLEEFIPLKNSDKPTARPAEGASWMVTPAQLWNPPASGDSPELHHLSIPPGAVSQRCFDGSPKLALDSSCIQRMSSTGGAFHPFSKDKINNKSDVAATASRRATMPAPELALGSPEKEKTEAPEYGSNGTGQSLMIIKRPESNYGNGEKAVATAAGKGGASVDGQSAASGNSQTHRKARRCWSPDLHRRFVNALQILGGSQVATPKQIRELMKVDGLTNDEVKSHLQKYRLHTRRPIPAPQAVAAAAAAPQLVVLGGIWVPPEYTAGPPIYRTTPVPQDFYPAALPALPPPPVRHQQQLTGHLACLAAYKGGRHVSPEYSDMRGGGSVGGGERSESIEEGEERDRDDDDDDDDEEEEKVQVMDGKAPLMVPAAEVDGGGEVQALNL